VLVALLDPTGTAGESAWDRGDLRFQGRRGAAGLVRRLQAMFPGATVRIEPGVPERAAIPPDQRCRLGLGASRLGEDCVLGAALWNATSRFRIHLGPLGREAFEGLAPGGPEHRALTELVEGWLDVPLDWTLRITLASEAASVARLGEAGPGRRLGVDTWLGRPSSASVTTELPPFVSPG
jgi:type VI secretion system protein ImpH